MNAGQPKNYECNSLKIHFGCATAAASIMAVLTALLFARKCLATNNERMVRYFYGWSGIFKLM